MKIDEFIYKMRHELYKEYGPKGENGLIKIGVTPDLFDRIVLDFAQRDTLIGVSTYSYYPSSCNKFIVNGIEIKVTEKNDF